MIKRINVFLILVLALCMTACDLIGPQIHTKLPLPELKPTQEDLAGSPLDNKDSESKKTTKVEIISGIENTLPSKTQFSSTEKAGSHGKGEYSLNFDDADLGEVAKVILSDILGKNYTISPEVTGKVTLQTTKPLSKEELLPTLDMLLEINNAALVNQSGMYLIKPSTEALYSTSLQKSSLPSGYQMRVVPVKNVSATEIGEILKPLLPEKALLHVDPNRNILLLMGSGSELNRALELVNIFDTDALKGRSFALFTPAHADASIIIDELEQIFNNRPGGAHAAGGAGGAKKDKEGGTGAGAASGVSSENSFYRFIEIDRLNAILTITHSPHFLKEVESWVLRLDKTNSEGKGGVNVYRAQHHSALELARTLSNIFGTGSQNSNSASVASGLKSLSATNKSGAGGGIGGTGNSGSGFGGSSSSVGGAGGSGSSSGFSNNSFGGGSSGGQSAMSAFGNTGGGANGSMGGAGQALMPNVKIIADESNNALIIVANSQEYATISRVLKQLDILPLQVMIDATIVEVTLNNDLQYGIEWYFTHNNGGTNVITGGDKSNSFTLSKIATGVATGGFSYAFSNPGHDIGALLTAAATNNNVNVISSPSLMVLNNQEATIQVGDSVPILSAQSTSLVSTGVTSNSVQMVDTGVNLSIKPRVNANGLVLMELLQSVNAAVTTKSSAIDSPTIQKRQIETSVAVQSGETIVLGGLIREENDYNRNGVPWLHELPLVGPMFGGTTRNKDKTELVVLLTPRVMKSRQDAQDVTEEFKHKLTGIYDEKLQVQVEEVQ